MWFCIVFAGHESVLRDEVLHKLCKSRSGCQAPLAFVLRYAARGFTSVRGLNYQVSL